MTWQEDVINRSLNLTTRFYDIDGDDLNFTALAGPNITVTIGNTTAEVNITPNSNFTGHSWVMFTAYDPSGLSVNSNNITINITPVNDEPTFTGTIPKLEWPEDVVNSSLNLSNYFSDIDQDSLSYNFTPVINISISINNNTGIVTFTPDANFSGARATIFTARDPSNTMVQSNNVTLNVTPVNDQPQIDTYVPISLTPSVVVNNSLVFNHTSSDIDNSTLIYSWKLDNVEKSTSLGWTFTPNSSQTGSHNITLNVSDGSLSVGLQWNVSVVTAANIDLSNFSRINDNKTLNIYLYRINNTGTSNLTAINWSFNTGESVVNASSLISIVPNETMFVVVEYNHTKTGDYVITATADDNSVTDSESIIIDITDIEITNLTVLNFSNTEAIFRLLVNNTLDINITTINWTFDTKNNYIINSTMDLNLTPSEMIYVIIDYNFTASGTYNVNATARNATYQDSVNKSMIV